MTSATTTSGTMSFNRPLMRSRRSRSVCGRSRSLSSMRALASRTTRMVQLERASRAINARGAARRDMSEKTSTLRVVRLIVCRCEVSYTGRLSAFLPESTRLLMLKEDGSVLIHADAGGYKPLDLVTPPPPVEGEGGAPQPGG